MFITNEINYKDFLPNRESFTKNNSLLICEEFGFRYLFFGEITPKDTGNIEIIFDILYKDPYKEPEVLIPTDEYKDLFIELKENCFSEVLGSNPFYILKKDDFIVIDEIRKEPYKVIIPAGSLVFKTMVDKQSKLAVIDTLKRFWNNEIFQKGRFVGYSKNKKEAVENK